MSVLKSNPVADSIASATTSPMKRIDLAAADFLELRALFNESLAAWEGKQPGETYRADLIGRMSVMSNRIRNL